MDGDDRQPGAGPTDDAATGTRGLSDASGPGAPPPPLFEGAPPPAAAPAPEQSSGDPEPSVSEEIATLVDDVRNYAQAEINFQKTRVKYAGKLAGAATGLLILALVLLHIALLALAVGLVIALEPLVTIWGAIAIVVGGLLIGMAVLGKFALDRARKLSALFSSKEPGP